MKVMLADLFKPAWKSNSIEKRLKAIAEMDSTSSEKQKILTQLATDDADVSICFAAIQKLSSAAVLHEISRKHNKNSVRVEAEKRLNALMATGSSLNEEQYYDLLNRYPELTVRIATHAEQTSVRTKAIQSLSPGQLSEVLSLSVYTDSRQLVAEKLTTIEVTIEVNMETSIDTNIEALESARKSVRGKDKNAERILKVKIDEFRKQQRQYAENLATVEKLCEEIEYLAGRDWRPEFKDKLLVHRKHWDELDFAIDPASKQRYQTASKIVDSRFEQQNFIEQTQLSQQQLVVELEDFLHNITGRDLSSFIESLSEIQTKLDQFSSNWQQLAVKIQPDLLIQNQYERMVHALSSATRLVFQAADILQDKSFAESDKSDLAGKIGDGQTRAEQTRDGQTRDGQTRAANKLAENSQQLNTALKQLKWPAIYGELQVATELQAQLTDWRNTQDTSAAERQQRLDRLHKKISSIFRFSRSGNLIRAKQLCEKVEKGLDQFVGKDRLALEQRFEEASKTLGDMGDWKNFATEPKYIELCEAMELLGSSKQHPDRLSKEMKDLQQHWKKLGHSDISEQYWPRFKQAADKVYQPCAEFFDQRHKIRQTNLAQRQQYVKQMQELLETTDWDNSPDYKAVQTAVRRFSEHFAGIKEVERKAGQKQWQQFSKFKDAVFARLDVAYEANIKLKHELIKQAEALATAAVKEDNLAKLKTLQIRWKQIGVTRRKQDQTAWTEFKKQGDIVYQQVQQLRQGKRAETDQQINAYRDIIKDIQKLAGTAKDLAEADQLFTALQAKYAELPELNRAETNQPDSYRSGSHRTEPHRSQSSGQFPEKLAASIQRDYRHACDLFDECHSRIVNNKHAQQLAALRLKADLCVQQEALGQSPSEAQLQQISQQWDVIELHDPVLSRRIEKRRNSAQTGIDRVAVGAERRMLCIQLEIAMDVPGPAEDKALRMQYQLEQMNKSGLGQQAVNSSEQLEVMELDWLCKPGAEPEQQKELDERFQRVLRAE